MIQDQIILSPIGDVYPGLIEPVARAVQKIFGFEIRVLRLLHDLDFAFDSSRNQYHSTPVLARLALEAPPRAIKVAGLCRVDLFIPILTYVYGEAQLDGRSCIVSTHRFKDPLTGTEFEDRFLSRMTKEIVHELGHTFNLRHCPDPVCLMHYCRNESDVDRKSDRLCRYCKVLLKDALQKSNEGNENSPKNP